MGRVAVAVRAARAAGRFPVVLSGNGNSAVGTLSGLTPARRAVFWFDAHGDGNTPDTLTATVPAYRPVQPEATFLLGARDLDPPEAALLAGSAITAVATSQIPARLPELLVRAPLEDALGYVAALDAILGVGA